MKDIKATLHPNGVVFKANNKRVIGVKDEDSAYIIIKSLNKTHCDLIRQGKPSFVGIDINDRNIHELTMHLSRETLEMLFLTIGKMLEE